MNYVRTFLLAVLCVWAAQLSAQSEDELNRSARDIFETVLSPYCPGRTISNCPSPQADELRANIRSQLAAGETADEVKEDLYAAFGDELRTIPRARGFGLLAWIVPGLAFGIGAWFILAWVRRMKKTTAEAPAPTKSTLDAETETRLAAEMADLD